MNSTLSWTAVLNQNGGWRLGAHQGSLHYTAPDRGSMVEKMQDIEKGKDTQAEFEIRNRKAEIERLGEMGSSKWKRREKEVEG